MPEASKALEKLHLTRGPDITHATLRCPKALPNILNRLLPLPIERGQKNKPLQQCLSQVKGLGFGDRRDEIRGPLGPRCICSRAR